MEHFHHTHKFRLDSRKNIIIVLSFVIPHSRKVSFLVKESLRFKVNFDSLGRRVV